MRHVYRRTQWFISWDSCVYHTYTGRSEVTVFCSCGFRWPSYQYKSRRPIYRILLCRPPAATHSRCGIFRGFLGQHQSSKTDTKQLRHCRQPCNGFHLGAVWTPDSINLLHSKHKTLTQCWLNYGPVSQTLSQHYTNML